MPEEAVLDPAIQYEIFKIMSAEVRHGQELLLLLGKHNADGVLLLFYSICRSNSRSAIVQLPNLT